MQPCSPAALQPCSPAALQPCNPVEAGAATLCVLPPLTPEPKPKPCAPCGAAGELRAIFGGGRYDKLLGSFGGEDLPAAGFGFGDAVSVESSNPSHHPNPNP